MYRIFPPGIQLGGDNSSSIEPTIAFYIYKKEKNPTVLKL